MKVIKKDGSIQSFDANKITNSILNATRDNQALLNESDIKIIIEDVIDRIKKIRRENDSTSSYEITGVVISVLDRDGFGDVINSFIGYKK
ncbi:ATP cone domain-containing protein [Clostridium sp. 1001271B_151109_B4]|uniref:ATP cone domain-containing protein n=1 Tax=Clostridium sp. 1001271B_151109_B4 TaxID=2787148 RepID=UPI0018AAE6D3